MTVSVDCNTAEIENVPIFLQKRKCQLQVTADSQCSVNEPLEEGPAQQDWPHGTKST